MYYKPTPSSTQSYWNGYGINTDTSLCYYNNSFFTVQESLPHAQLLSHAAGNMQPVSIDVLLY